MAVLMSALLENTGTIAETVSAFNGRTIEARGRYLADDDLESDVRALDEETEGYFCYYPGSPARTAGSQLVVGNANISGFAMFNVPEPGTSPLSDLFDVCDELFFALMKESYWSNLGAKPISGSWALAEDGVPDGILVVLFEISFDAGIIC